jgi:uncharacterized membrane protein YjgN (DUF898 family)
MNEERVEYGSMGAGIAVGIVLLVLLGWIPFVGWIIAGFAAGLSSRGALRGVFSGLISGVVVSAVLISVILFLSVGNINTIFGYLGNSYLVSSIKGLVMHLEVYGSTDLIKAVVINGIAIPAVAGLAGGGIMSRGYLVQESYEEEPVPAPLPNKVESKD